MNERDRILSVLVDVPGLPAAATRILTLIQNENTSIAEIMAEVEYDPGLTADVLRLANSAYFAGPRKISSLRDAGVLFGLNRIMHLTLASAVFPLASKPIIGYDLPAGALLDHMIAVAIGAEELGKKLNLPAPAYTFTAGLLHDIGKIIMGTFAGVNVEAISEMATTQKIPFNIAEQHVLGIDHAEAGAALLKFWNFPQNIIDVVQWHHQPENFPGDSLVVDLVHVADMLSVECGLGVGIDGLNYCPSPVVIERMRLDPASMEQISCIMLTELEKIRRQWETAH